MELWLHCQVERGGALNRLTSHAPASNQCKQAQGKVSGSAVRHLSAQLKDN